jgi:hypothetical protein
MWRVGRVVHFACIRAVVPHALIGLVTCKLGKRSRLFELSSKACPLGACREGSLRFSVRASAKVLAYDPANHCAACCRFSAARSTIAYIVSSRLCTWLHAMHPCRHYRPGETDGVEGNGIWPVQSGERSVHAVRQRHGGYGKRTVRRSRFGSDSGRPPDVTPYKIWFFLPPLLISVQALQNS